MSTLFWVGLPLQVPFAAVWTFWIFHNGWGTFVLSLGVQVAFWVLAGRKGWV